jgi:hypothetical protein
MEKPLASAVFQAGGCLASHPPEQKKRAQQQRDGGGNARKPQEPAADRPQRGKAARRHDGENDISIESDGSRESFI